MSGPSASISLISLSILARRFRWFTADTFSHTVTSDDGFFDFGELKPGETFSVRFDELGKWRYHSTMDPNMTGSVIVRVPGWGEATALGESISGLAQPTGGSTQPASDSSASLDSSVLS